MPLFFLFSHYFIDHSAVKYLIINILFINGGTFIPQNCQIIAKMIMNIKICCNNVAIIWGIFTPIREDREKIRRNNLLQFTKDWEKTNKYISSNLREIGRK